jgi:signal transduction histidine kinase
LAGIQADAADVVGKPFWDSPWFSATPGARETVLTSFNAVKRGESIRAEMLLHLPTGERYLDFAMRPLFDHQGAVAGVLPEAVDITERRQAEEALRHSQKMEAVGQLTGGVAHDFNNLLTIIRSATDFLRRRELPEDRRRRYVDAISDTVDRASKLTGQLLAFARRQPLMHRCSTSARKSKASRSCCARWSVRESRSASIAAIPAVSRLPTSRNSRRP